MQGESEFTKKSTNRISTGRVKSPPQHDTTNPIDPRSRRIGTGANSPELAQPPRIPDHINPAPATTPPHQTSKPHGDTPVIFYTTQLQSNIRSVSSTGSIRTQDSEETPTKKRKRLLPFRNKFVGSWKEGTLTQESTSVDLPNDIAPPTVAVQNDPTVAQPGAGSIDILTDLKPAAAKRLGIEHGDTSGVGNILIQSSSSTRQPSRNHSPTSSTAFIPKSRQDGHTFARQILERPGAPDHTLQPLHTHDFDVPADSFFWSSSDSEDEEDQQSGYSWRSSHTSYNLTTSVDGDSKEPQEQTTDMSPSRQHIGRSPVKSRHSSSNHSPNSSGNFPRVGIPSPPGSRPTSFSRPFGRPPSARSSSLSTSLDLRSSVAESSLQPQLAAIKEDPSIQSLDSVEETSNLAQVETKSANSTRNGPSSLANLAHVRGSEKSKVLTDENHPPAPVASPSQDNLKLNRSIDKIGQTAAIVSTQYPSARPLSLAITQDSEAPISSEAAEVIILQIFEKLDSFQDLFACAKVNQGFFRIFKRHELRLMKNALRNMSPAQWELREASPKEIISAYRGPSSDYTPTTYIQFHRRDAFVIRSVKSLMASRCRTQMRPETVKALVGYDPIRLKRTEEALWRIWTFCTIFGPEKGREHDTEAQIDWLRGKNRTDRPNSPATIVMNQAAQSSFLVSQELESFGRGNYGGLTIDELDDMIEAWNCIKHLTQGISGRGRCEQAKECGIFDNSLKNGEDARTEEALLDEWIFYLRALGLSTVADLAHYTQSPSDDVFTVASDMEWTTWTRPEYGTTRQNFLQESVQKLRDEMTTKAKQVTFEEVQEKRKSKGLELSALLREEKAKSLTSRDTLYQHNDQSVSLWLAWMSRAESTHANGRNEGAQSRLNKGGVLSDLNDERSQPSVNKRDTPSQPTKAQPKMESRPTVREHRSNSGLSLFPPQYTRSTPSATPRMSPMSTPMRSRSNSRTNSIVQPLAQPIKSMAQATTPQEPQPNGDRDSRESKQQTFSPRLSMCPEV